MSKLDDEGGAPGAGREDDARHNESAHAYDPFLNPWAERPPARRVPCEDDLFPLDEHAPERPHRREDIPGRPFARDAYPPERTQSYYPPPYQPGTESPTELQRRLQEETITIPRREHRWGVTIREMSETLLLAVLIFLAVRASLQNFRVEGASMQPSLENGEYLIVNKLAYTQLDLSFLNWLPFVETHGPAKHLWSAPNRGDIVVFRSPTSINRDFIKRIIGLPGDAVEINDESGQVTVNGQPLNEPYIQGSTRCGAQCVRQIPPKDSPEARAECGSNACYFVMGDNRQNSSDSRQGWLVPEENIIGKALITYWHDGGPELAPAPNHSVGLASQD
jgi:signal peptidase I